MVPYLRAANVKDGRLDLSDVKLMDFNPSEQSIFGLRRGDVLVTEGAGSLAAVGASAVYNGEIDGIVCFQNTLLRLRPREGADTGFLLWWARHAFGSGIFASIAEGANIFHLSAGNVRTVAVAVPGLSEQRAIADYLDTEISALDDLRAKKRKLVEALQERIDASIMEFVGHSTLVNGGNRVRALAIRRQLRRLDRASETGAEVVTAFRDGQVTARSLRRSEGFTESWTEGAHVQGVRRGDVVVHGLDGFAGAIGTSEADGACSPVYHVCAPIDGGDAHFYGRMLRLLATTGYLGNFATSTRERAVDFRNWDFFGNIPIPAVPVAEQHRIGERIRRLSPVRESIVRSQALINERKQALITAAVTGELEFSGVPA